MSWFGERRGAASHSKESLLRKQARVLLDLANAVTKTPDYSRLAESVAQQYVNRMIILEQFPRARILQDELPQLANLNGLLDYAIGSNLKRYVVKEVAQVSTNA